MTQSNTCTVDQCDNKQKSRGLCSKHYARWQKFGTTDLPERDRSCSVEGCTDDRRWRGMCLKHRRRMDKHGHTDDPEPEPEFCTVASCGNKRLARGLCSTHYSRQRKGQDLDAPILKWDAAGRSSICVVEECDRVVYRGRHCYAHHTPCQEPLVTDDGLRVCRTCNHPQDPDQFVRDKSVTDGLATECNLCRADRVRYNTYKLTPEAFEDLRNAQGDACAICKGSFAGVATKNIHVDHDHTCCKGKKTCGRCVRSLLCGQCNTGIGMFKDNPELLDNAAAYLRNHQINSGG